MIRPLFFIYGICCFAMSLQARQLRDQVEAYVDRVHGSIGFRGAVLVAKDGEIIWSGGRGRVSTESEAKIDDRSLFEIASCTKPITALAIVKLAEDGKLDLDDSIAKHLDDVPDNCRAITLRHLLDHTSGIPGSNVSGHPTDFKIALEKFLQGGPRYQPGKRYQYWNQGYSILSEVIAKASGKSYTEFVRKAIFEPAGMSGTCFTGDPCPPGMTAVVGNAQGRRPRSSLEHPYGSYGYQYRGMGGVVTSLNDLWKLDRALVDHSLLSEEAFEAMIAVSPGRTGLGWSVESAPDGTKSHGHGGSVRGFLASIKRYPSIDGCIVVLECDQNSTAFSVLQAGLQQILFSKPAPFIPSGISETDQRRLLGMYFDDRRRALSVSPNPQAAGSAENFPRLQINWGSISTIGILGKDDQQKIRLYLRGKDGLKDDGVIDFQPVGSQAQTATLRFEGGKELVFRRPQKRGPRPLSP